MKRKPKAKDPSASKQANTDWLTAREKEHQQMRQSLNRERLANPWTDVGALHAETPAKGQRDGSQ